MSQENQVLKNITTRVRQLILLTQSAKEENAALKSQLATKEEEIKKLREQLQEQRDNYNHLKTARLLEVSDGDVQSAKARLTKMIKDVNRSLTLLGY